MSMFSHATLREAADQRPSVKPMPHQEDLAGATLEILRSASHAYLEAPTGTGKTLICAAVGNALPGFQKLFLANTLDLVAQARDEFLDLEDCGFISDLSSWRFHTWQAFRAASDCGRLADLVGSDPVVAFVDECHIGGTAHSCGENKSFRIIRENCSKTVWVSATPWQIDEDLLGRREGHTARLSSTEAYDLGLMSDVDVVRVDCGLKITAATAFIEQKTGRNFEDLSVADVDFEASTVDDAYEILASIAQRLDRGELGVRDVASIVEFRWRIMADLYLDRHSGEKAIFWLPNQAHARACAAYLTRRLPGTNRAHAFIAVSRDPIETARDHRELQSFKNADGDCRVAAVVYRLREGFNLPSLALGFDCSWHPKSPRVAVQKIGRLTRRSFGKNGATYYYAVDVRTVAGLNGRTISDKVIDYISRETGRDTIDVRGSVVAALEMSAIRDAMGLAAGPTNGGDVNLRRTALGSTESRRPLFDFRSIEGSKEHSHIPLSAIFALGEGYTDDPVLLPRIIAYEGVMPPPTTRAYRTIWKILRSDTSEGAAARQLLAHLVKIRAYNGFRKVGKEELWARVEKTIQAIEAGGERPRSTSEEGRELYRAISKGTYFNSAMRDRLLRLNRPDLRLKAQQSPVKASEIERIVGAIERGEEPPKPGTADHAKLHGWVSSFGRKRIPGVRDRIARVRPDLLPRGVSYEDRDAAFHVAAKALVTAVLGGAALTRKQYEMLRYWRERPGGTRHADYWSQIAHLVPDVKLAVPRNDFVERAEALVGAVQLGGPLTNQQRDLLKSWRKKPQNPRYADYLVRVEGLLSARRAAKSAKALPLK